MKGHFAINAHLGSPPDTVLWKFLAPWKFDSLLSSRALWFSSFEILRKADEAEGRVPPPNLVPPVDAFIEMLGPHFAHAAGVAEAVGRAFSQKVEEELRLNLVTCWFMGEEPLAHMWDRYASDPGGVAIKSRTFKVGAAVDNNGQAQVFAFPCTYVDDDTAVTMKHFLAPFFVKRREFEDEWEMRYLVHTAEALDPGSSVEVRLQELFEHVLVNTGGDAGNLDKVREKLAAAGLNIPVEAGR